MEPGSNAPGSTAMARLARSWVYGGFLAGFVILLLVPVFTAGLAPAFVFVVLQLPLYMIHQYEEHDADRFRAFVNRVVGGGHDVLPVGAVFVINVVGVWVLDVVVIWLAAGLGIGFGLIAVYATLVNAVVHVVPALVTRRYNPGLVTALVLLLPVGGIGAWTITATGRAGLPYHLLGLGVALALHLVIVGYVLRNRLRLTGA